MREMDQVMNHVILKKTNTNNSYQIPTIPTRFTQIHTDPIPTRIQPDSRWTPGGLQVESHQIPTTLFCCIYFYIILYYIIYYYYYYYYYYYHQKIWHP